MEEHKRLKGIFFEKGRLFTRSLGGKEPVYGEHVVVRDGSVYRQWNPKRSKLGAAVKKDISQIGIRPDISVLYLGSSSGTTVSHVADIVGKDGFVYALDHSRVPLQRLFKVVDRWPNIAPLYHDASRPDDYAHLIDGVVDVVFQDVAQKHQVQIFLDNLRFCKPGGFGVLSVKAKSIDVTKRSKEVFASVADQLADIVDKRSLEPYEKDHMIFVVKRR